MPWCPKCGTEYGEDFKLCGECGIELVDELEQKKREAKDFDKEALLISVANDIEANVIESLLQTYGIPVFRKSVGADAILRIDIGGVIEGVYLYVPSRLLNIAKEIIGTQQQQGKESDIKVDDEGLPAENQDEFEFEKEFNRKRRMRTWIILGVFYIPGLIFMIIGLIYLLFQLFTGGIGL